MVKLKMDKVNSIMLHRHHHGYILVIHRFLRILKRVYFANLTEIIYSTIKKLAQK